MPAVYLVAKCRLTGGCRHTMAPGYYCFYDTALDCTNGTVVDVELRVYCPPSEAFLADGTIVLHLDLYCGDASDHFRASVWAEGTALNDAELSASDGRSRLFDLAVSQWFRGGTKSFVLTCRYEGNVRRWMRTRTPDRNTLARITGTIKEVASSGNLTIDVVDIDLTVGSVLPSSATTRTTPLWPATASVSVPASTYTEDDM